MNWSEENPSAAGGGGEAAAAALASVANNDGKRRRNRRKSEETGPAAKAQPRNNDNRRKSASVRWPQLARKSSWLQLSMTALSRPASLHENVRKPASIMADSNTGVAHRRKCSNSIRRRSALLAASIGYLAIYLAKLALWRREAANLPSRRSPIEKLSEM